MSESDAFRSKDEEVSKLLEEIVSLRDVMREISRKLSNLELRAKRAFPTAAAKTSQVKRAVKITEPPSLSRETALQLFDKVVEQARAGSHEDATKLLDQLSLPDLHLMFKELGLSLGKNSPSRKTLVGGILGRVKQSMMLSQHSPPQVRS